MQRKSLFEILSEFRVDTYEFFFNKVSGPTLLGSLGP